MAIAAIGTASSMREDAASAISLASTDRLLTEGGDTRIALATGQAGNCYGCPPHPDANLLAFGSSTASVISTAGFAAADRLRRRLLHANTTNASAYARELDRVRAELIALCGLSTLRGLDVVLAASGTDLHLVCSRLAAGAGSQPTLAVMVNAEETGSGVPAAVAGRHFGNRAALGTAVTEGACIDRNGGTDVVSVPIRDADGTPRDAATIDSEIEAQVRQAVASGKRVLLVMVDVSKTGMVAPSPACAAALRRLWPESVDVLVDACQFRIAPATLRAYLEQDFMVAVTGSKFLTGPTFSGALFIPENIGDRLRGASLSSLPAYSCRADWPNDWSSAQALNDMPNFGLLLRWEAALAELHAFRALPEREVTRFFHAFAQAIQARLQGDACFAPLPVPPLDRGTLSPANGWDGIPTIFPFLLCRRGPGGNTSPFNREQTAHIYRLLQQDLSGVYREAAAALRWQPGQPVACGERGGIPVSALRICASARLAVEAASGGHDTVIRRALAVLDKTALLVRYADLPQIARATT
jgi:hypothetical protein